MDHLKTAAVLWWQSKRPVAWSEEDHVQSPTVNCVTEEEKRLAIEVAMVVEQQGVVMENELRECPRCRSNDCAFMELSNGRVFPLCPHCELKGPLFENSGEAVEWWNTRVTDPLMEEFAEALTLTVGFLKKYGLRGPEFKAGEKALLKYSEVKGE